MVGRGGYLPAAFWCPLARSMLDIRNLTFAYSNQTAPLFRDFSWRVERGDFWSIIGASGCGKSTLLHLIVGVRQAAAGEITVNGESVPRKKNRGKTGLVLQDYGLLPWATVYENVALGLKIRGFYGQDFPSSHSSSTKGVGEAIDFWLERFGVASLRNKYPSQISGGQRQRAAIARTLVLQPDLLLMDEPFSALDAPTRDDLELLTLNLQNETKTTTVFVTHSIEEAVFLGRRILVLDTPPPSSSPRVVENARAGRAAYRDEPEFLEQARLLRGMLQHHA